MLVLLAQISANMLNSIGLVALRHYAPTSYELVRVVFWGYGISSVILATLLLHRPPKLSQTMGMIPWSLALVLIYVLYVYFPRTVTFSQLVVIQGSVPLLAALLKYFHARVEGAPPFNWLRALPLSMLLLIALIQWTPGGDIWVLAALALAYFVAQYSGRIHSDRDRKEVILQLNCLCVLFLGIWAAMEGISLLPQTRTDLLAFSLFGLTLVSVQSLFLYGLRHGSLVLSSLGISTSVPIGIGIEAWITRARPSPLIMTLATSYLLATLFLALPKDRDAIRL